MGDVVTLQNLVRHRRAELSKEIVQFCGSTKGFITPILGVFTFSGGKRKLSVFAFLPTYQSELQDWANHIPSIERLVVFLQ